MQDVGSRDPSFEDRNKRLPPFACPLTAACECLVPQSIDALPEGAQLSEITRYCVVAVITDDDATEPCTGLSGAIMHTAMKLTLDGLELRCHARFRCDAPDGEGAGLVPLPTVVGEAQEVERRRFSLSSQLSISGSIAPELDQPGLLRMERQRVLLKPVAHPVEEPTGVGLVLEADDEVSGAGGSHPRALAEPDMTLSRHPAPIVRPRP